MLNRSTGFVLLSFVLSTVQAATIEKRGGSDWPTRNHLRFEVNVTAATGAPVLAIQNLPAESNPDSVRVFGPDSRDAIRSKIEWRTPQVQVFWASKGPGTYHVYFDLRNEGETERQIAPAMVGAGDPITFGRAATGALAVGLWAHPAAIDWDGDGNLDLVVSCASGSYSGIFLFRNLGTNEKPLFDRGEWLGPGKASLVAADFNGDGAMESVRRMDAWRCWKIVRLGERNQISRPRDISNRWIRM
jgi:hypothetical protein